MSQLQDEIFRIAHFQVKALLIKMMGSDDGLDDCDVVPIIDAFAQATQNACPDCEGLYEAIMSEAFEVFNEFCVKADPENTRQDNLRYFQKLRPKSSKMKKRGLINNVF